MTTGTSAAGTTQDAGGSKQTTNGYGSRNDSAAGTPAQKRKTTYGTDVNHNPGTGLNDTASTNRKGERMSMLQSRKSGAYYYCCNESLVIVGIARSREEREWRSDYLRGEVDGGYPYLETDDVHSLTEPGGFCADWTGSGTGDGAWDYEQEDVPFWLYQAIIPAEHRLPQAA